ncbi:C4-dicarboxylate ABC transporter [Vibrio breoganii]|uniref:Sigma-54-dependent Fis family transcriptional regulator n=1 Tax=Vibrio breoganii TaxID=553239 RepID=A0ABX1UCR4_9VIBR|nr:sigma-54 dependent transcriptional regulator [Vibrio breoganii]NMO72037.1 sigma-54-dependent Fis family transcriptional regulator [Vibrio breoganii]NMR70530.1 sigma-54-dependent Fis family transcriptional regulator [Vibrio breoganii]PMF99022.1 C4-dicarboxylate ABC transporter [Vibrio breoganii]PML86859.1 C4-dicarboxylate ABC transporter [Vibrio breoganii]PMO82835.1 C4-dicarboxylate ABC transporter [Vibrio breoganii]
MCHAFIIDDEPEIRSALKQSFELEGIEAQFYENAELALQALESTLPHVIISDIRLPGLSGLDLLEGLNKQHPELPIILITGHGDISMAVEAMHKGAYDFIEKPFATDRLLDTTKRAIEKRQLTIENQRLRNSLKASQTLGPRIIGDTSAILNLKETITHIADTSADILIFGETGTGKELVARSLHEQSGRRDNNFVAVNCGAIPENLIESELYGHEKGAFTGAESRRIGKLEHAQNGTLFLDEIESMPMQAQIRLLRVLQERAIERVGSNSLIPIDIRVIAATKVDLKQAAQQGSFREDLYYRLNVVTLELPPLRERKEDIATLFHHFLLVAASRYGKTSQALSSQDLSLLLNHDWPGNVRELRNMAERFVLLGRLTLENSSTNEKSDLSLAEQVAEFEKYTLEQALTDNHGSIKQTMETLQLARKTLYDKMQRYQLDKDNFKAD